MNKYVHHLLVCPEKGENEKQLRRWREKREKRREDGVRFSSESPFHKSTEQPSWWLSFSLVSAVLPIKI